MHINTTATTYNLELNRKARLERHKRMLGERGWLTVFSSRVKTMKDELGASIKHRLALSSVSLPLTRFRMPVNSMPLSTRKAVLRNILIIAALLLGLTGFSGTSFAEANAYLSQYDDAIVMDQDGYFTKMTPIEAENTETRTKSITHIIGQNETVSEIAALYGLKTQTILWENNVNPTRIHGGEKVIIPPFDGAGYTVKSGDTAGKIAKKYGISADDILKRNNITSLPKGERIYLPNARPIQEQLPRESVARTSTSSRYNLPLTNSTASPSGTRPFIYPTMGSVTQSFRRGHYAIDIANSNKPPIWAAGNGVVEKVSTGTWGGGYGNHVIIRHPNGLETLYGHLDSVAVTEGQEITQGQVIGRMGRTGRVRGVTGIHLHFEVIDHGVKKVPSLYY